MKILLANPRGFCAGVDRAIEIVERALELFGKPIYVRHEVVHNKYVVGCLRNRWGKLSRLGEARRIHRVDGSMVDREGPGSAGPDVRKSP